MVLSRAVEHYLDLREQGMSHERAVEHTRSRHGIFPGDLAIQLREARARLLAAAALIPAPFVAVAAEPEIAANCGRLQ